MIEFSMSGSGNISVWVAGDGNTVSVCSRPYVTLTRPVRRGTVGGIEGPFSHPGDVSVCWGGGGFGWFPGGGGGAGGRSANGMVPAAVRLFADVEHGGAVSPGGAGGDFGC